MTAILAARLNWLVSLGGYSATVGLGGDWYAYSFLSVCLRGVGIGDVALRLEHRVCGRLTLLAFKRWLQPGPRSAGRMASLLSLVSRLRAALCASKYTAAGRCRGPPVGKLRSAPAPRLPALLSAGELHLWVWAGLHLWASRYLLSPRLPPSPLSRGLVGHQRTHLRTLCGDDPSGIKPTVGIAVVG
jgi:hypothetical protein